jgi:signal peptidase I
MFLRRLMKDLVLPVAVAITLALLIQAAVAKPYEIPTESMDPTIHPHDRIIANRLIYHFRDISRGDIIVFHPTAEARADCPSGAPPSTPYVKRVIGLPGDTVSIIWGTRDVEINGKRFTVPAARLNNPSNLPDPQNPTSTYKVPAGELFVLGDNRPASCDSHMWKSNPYVPIGNVIGQAEVTYWPLRSATFLN